MSISTRRVAILSIVTALIVLVLCERLASAWVRHRVLSAIERANIRARDVSIRMLTRSVIIHDVHWSSAIDSSFVAQDSIGFRHLAARGVSVFALLRDNRLRIRSVVAEDGFVYVRHRIDSAGQLEAATPALTGVDIESLQFSNTSFEIDTDSLTTWSFTGEGKLNMISLNDMEDPLSSLEAPLIEINLRTISMDQVRGFDQLKIASLTYDRNKKVLRCDSLEVIPTYSRLEYSRKKGTQSTWTRVTLPHLTVEGLDVKMHDDTTLTVSKILIDGAKITAFRDRRVPLRRRTEVPLPMKWFRELNMGVEIDSILIDDMDVVYEHVSEDGSSPGKLSFDELNATITNVVNREYENQPQHATINASSSIMGKGKIEAEFILPVSKTVPYTAKGNIRSLPLKSLNPMLENTVFASIEDGRLNSVLFEFSYDNEKSQGVLSIDYENLKIKSLKKDTRERDQLKTLVVNTAVKNNRERTGVIETDRDKRRFIFHYWATSLMDGIRSAVLPVAPQGKKK